MLRVIAGDEHVEAVLDEALGFFKDAGKRLPLVDRIDEQHPRAGVVGKWVYAREARRLLEFEALRDRARDIKNHTLAHLDFYLEQFEAKVVENGGHVHWASTPEEAREAVIGILRASGARHVTKGKSMAGEETGLNEALAEAGMERLETDLGEYIIQLADEPPSHIIAPAIHVVQDQISEAFYAAHKAYPPERPLTEPRQLLDPQLQLQDWHCYLDFYIL